MAASPPPRTVRDIAEWCREAGTETGVCRVATSLAEGSLESFEIGVREYLERLVGSVEGRVYASAGPLEHWLDSIRYAKQWGLLPWACSHEAARERGGPNWQQLYRVLANPYVGGVLLPPLVAYWASRCGLIGVGVVVAAEVTHYGTIWSGEACPPQGGSRPCYSIRWYTIPLLLAPADARECATIGDLVLPAEARNCVQSLVGPKTRERAKAFVEALLERLMRGGLEQHLRRAFGLIASAATRSGAATTLVRLPAAVASEPWTALLRDVHGVAGRIAAGLRRVGIRLPRGAVEMLVGLLGVGNVLLAGPPGMGKTLLARLAAEAAGAELVVVSGHAGLSRADIIGGPVLAGGALRWRSGAFLRALASALGGRRVLLLLDEVNRMDVDRVAGELFTIFSSPVSEGWSLEPLEAVCGEAEGYGPDEAARRVCVTLQSSREVVEEALRGGLRVAATMNTVDYATLFTVGEALARRFYKIVLTPSTRSEEIRGEVETAAEAVEARWRTRGVNLRVSGDALDVAARLFESLRGRAASYGFVTPLAVGPGAVLDLLEAAAAAAHARSSEVVEARDVCAAAEAIVPVNALLDEEWRGAWREAVAAACRGEGGAR